LWSPNCFPIERSCICLSLLTNKATKRLVVSYISESWLMRNAFDFTYQEIVYQEIMHWDVKRQGTEYLLVNGLIECHRRLALCQDVALWSCYPLNVCIRGGPSRPLHRDLQWSIVLCATPYCTLRVNILVFLYLFLYVRNAISQVEASNGKQQLIRTFIEIGGSLKVQAK
jgi:hypothetical protein